MQVRIARCSQLLHKVVLSLVINFLINIKMKYNTF